MKQPRQTYIVDKERERRALAALDALRDDPGEDATDELPEEQELPEEPDDTIAIFYK
jgi:hypothetical protein